MINESDQKCKFVMVCKTLPAMLSPRHVFGKSKEMHHVFHCSIGLWSNLYGCFRSIGFCEIALMKAE